MVKFSHFVRMGVDRSRMHCVNRGGSRSAITRTLEHIGRLLHRQFVGSPLSLLYSDGEDRAIIAEKARICTAISLIASDCGKLNSLFLLISFSFLSFISALFCFTAIAITD